MAFLLGWQSKMVLVHNASDKPMRLYLIGLYLEKLDVRLPRLSNTIWAIPKEMAETERKKLTWFHK